MGGIKPRRWFSWRFWRLAWSYGFCDSRIINVTDDKGLWAHILSGFYWQKERRLYVRRFSMSDFLRSLFRRTVLGQLATINKTLATIKKEIRKMSDLTIKLQEEMEELVANVAANTDATQSAVVAIEGLATKQAELIEELRAATEANDPTAVAAALANLEAQNDLLVANTSKLAAAIPAGTPVELPVG